MWKTLKRWYRQRYVKPRLERLYEQQRLELACHAADKAKSARLHEAYIAEYGEFHALWRDGVRLAAQMHHTIDEGIGDMHHYRIHKEGVFTRDFIVDLRLYLDKLEKAIADHANKAEQEWQSMSEPSS